MASALDRVVRSMGPRAKHPIARRCKPDLDVASVGDQPECSLDGGDAASVDSTEHAVILHLPNDVLDPHAP